MESGMRSERCRGSCGLSDMHAQCDDEASLLCQQKLHTGKILGIIIWRACRPSYPLVVIGTIQNISDSTAKSAGAPSCMYSTCWYGYSFLFWYVELVPKASPNFSIRRTDHATLLYPLKLALTSPTSGGRSVSIVRSRTKATELVS
jgi:hypothetical protein